MSSSYLTFNGKKYQLYDAYPTKEMAEHYADDLRKQEALVRVIPNGEGRLKYQLYIYAKWNR